MRRAIATAQRVAASDAAVLITGESGTGKNALASAIHAWSPRHRGPFLTVSRSTLADDGLESDLLDVDAARGGTLFLDEVSDLEPELQAKLLRVLAEQRFDGATAAGTSELDARIVTASRRNLDAEVRAGRFREDLFFRLSVVTIVLPPLRERSDDLPMLADRILGQLAVRHLRPGLRLGADARRMFASHHWPGNIRELANVLERAVVLSRGEVITTEHVCDGLRAPGIPSNGASLSLRELERRQIGRALAESATLDEAAARLGIDPSTLWRKRKRYGLE